MSRRFVIPLMMFALACMGAECSGSSSRSSTSNGATQSAAFETNGPERPTQGAIPVPEPSAALVFGAGLLIAGLASRRKRS